ncbi:hypothetical protein E1A91_D13G036700v1 [Gossypium mustelinum]|uniref:Plastocyanin-like domain-containing protein n=1 Tax=Gossypium mustelinum TaxID=34275 RepID=A0A5D2RYE1_GOSMU|nr:hypothetical protein E1A91_D13G036700v1 [Gossypium mustelinum]
MVVFSNMASLKVTVTFLFCIILLFAYQHVSAIRPLPHVEDHLFAVIFNKNLIIQVLQRGMVPPSGGNPCTNISRRSGGGTYTSNLFLVNWFFFSGEEPMGNYCRIQLVDNSFYLFYYYSNVSMTGLRFILISLFKYNIL